PFAHFHGDIGDAGERFGQRGQLMEVGGEQRTAARCLVQRFYGSPGNGEAVEGCGAAADLVEDDERAAGGAIEDGGGFDHFDHEGRAAMGDVVGSADAGEEPVND